MTEKTKRGDLVVHDQDQQPPNLPQVINQPSGEIVGVASIFDIDPKQFKAGLARRKKNRDALMDWIRDALVEGTDWGRIHVIKKEQCDAGRYCTNPYHFSKPSLWKPGAEKIVGMMNLRADYPNAAEWLQKVLRGETLSQLGFICNLVNKEGAIVSSGIGMRTLAQDGDANKAFKMAKKSALIDAVLGAGGLSEVFTQDVEDMDPDKISGQQDPYNQNAEPTDSVFGRRPSAPIETHCPIGKEWKGKPWSEVDHGFLCWIITTVADKPDLVNAAQEEINRRYMDTKPKEEARLDAKIDAGMGRAKKLGEYARELTTATNIDQIIALKEELPAEFEPSLRSFIKQREKELGPK